MILEAARASLARSGFTISKGPSVLPERAEVSVVVTALPESKQLAEIREAFTALTGFRLTVSSAAMPKSEDRPGRDPIIEIPIHRIRLSGYHQSLSLDPVKLEKAIERARTMGITPPIQVRRVRDGYILSDGLYRMTAAEALGLERIPAVVE
jgi:hypothetical protein